MRVFHFACALALLVLVQSSALAASLAPDTDNPFFERRKKDMLMEKAVEDIDGNFPLIVAMSESFGESWYMTWGWWLADRLPSQPVAVIKVFAATRAKDNLAMVCPRFPSDDPAYAGSEFHYLSRTAEALSSFTLANPAEEAVRKECLANVRENIQLMQKQYPNLKPASPWPVKER